MARKKILSLQQTVHDVDCVLYWQAPKGHPGDRVSLEPPDFLVNSPVTLGGT